MNELNDAFSQAQTLTVPPEVDTTPAAPAADPATPAMPTALSLKDDDLLEYTVGGQKMTAPWSQIRQQQAMLPGDYTRKTQELARQREEFSQAQTQFQSYAQQQQQREQMLNAALSDPNKLGALYLAALGRTQGQQPGTPQAPAPVDPQALMAQMSQVMDQQLNARWDAFQTAQRQASYETDLGGFSKSALAGTHLEGLPGADDMLWGQVVAMRPGSAEEAKQMFQLVAGDYNSKLAARMSNGVAVAAVNAAKATNGIEPRGGAAPAPVARSYKNLEDPALRQDVLDYFKQHGVS